MRKTYNIFKSAALCILAAMLSVSCLEKEGPAADMQGVMIQLSVSAGEMTKAAYEDATSSEKVINTLRVYAFHEGRPAGYASRQATALGEPFYMDLELPENQTCQVDFYLIANEAEMAYENGLVQLSEDMTVDQLEAIRFTGLAQRAALPMYCFKSVGITVPSASSVNTAPGHEGHFILPDPVTFVLERSLAKLSVSAAKAEGAAATPQILSVELLAQGTREYSYLFPQTDENVLDNVASRSNNRSLLSAPVEVAATSYTAVVNEIYMPEVREGLHHDDPSYRWNVFTGPESDRARAAVLHVEYSLGAGLERRDGYIYLPKVERNHHINVCILINAEGQITINYVVADWDWDEDKMQNWFFDYPTHSYLWHMLPQTEDDLHARPSDKATMSETQPFIGYFQMTYPDSDMWVPTLEGLNASDCSIRVYDTATSVLVFSSDSPAPLPVSEDWYRIEVSPNPGQLDEGDVVNLAITYTPGGFTESEYLLINGADLEYFWPGSSNENYVTITMVNQN